LAISEKPGLSERCDSPTFQGSLTSSERKTAAAKLNKKVASILKNQSIDAKHCKTHI
jgi:hypothetical protein